jgi:hypothetical protein
MVGINEVRRFIQLQNERHSINGRITDLKRSHLWNDDEKVKLLRTYESNLKEVEDSLIINPFA